MDKIDIATGSESEPMMWEVSGFRVARLLQIKKVIFRLCKNEKGLFTFLSKFNSTFQGSHHLNI